MVLMNSNLEAQMTKGRGQRSVVRRFVSDRIKDFKPSWFAAVMGTGAVSALLHSFPYGHKPALHAFGVAFLLLNVILLFLLLGFVTRYVRHPEVFKMMFMDPLQSLYVGCLPMGFGTIINALLNLRNDYFPESRTFVYVLWGLWWLDTAISVPVYFLILYTMISRHEHSAQGINAVWLLPAITLIVPSTTGALLAQALVPYSTRHTIISLFVSTAALVLGLGLALMLMALYILRLITVGLPDKTLIATKFIPIGPCGQGGWAFIVLGQVAAKLAKEKVNQNVLLEAAQPLELLGFAAGYFFWTFGIWWVVLAIVATYETFWKNPPKYNAGFWGMVFPMGVYSMLTIYLSEVLDSPFFRVVASVLCIFVFALWTTLAVMTVRDLIEDSEELLNAPFESNDPQSERAQNESGLEDRSSSMDTVC